MNPGELASACSAVPRANAASPGGEGVPPAASRLEVRAVSRGRDHYAVVSLHSGDGSVSLAAELTFDELLDLAATARAAAATIAAARAGGNVVPFIRKG